jgi:excisionase family DNA binding protein
VARELNISPATIRRWFKDGILQGTRTSPRSIRIYKSSLDKLLKGSRNGKANKNK